MLFHKKKKNIFIYMCTFLFALSGLFLLNNVFGKDLMEQAFGAAVSYDTIINIGNTKDSVGNTVLRETMTLEMNENLGRGCFINGQYISVDQNKCTEMGGDWNIRAIDVNAKAPLMVRITKFLLRMTIVLSITMIIFNAVKYMIEVLGGKDRKSADAKKNLIFIAAGILIALMSVSVINLVVSVPKSSIKTSDDLSAFQFGCKIGINIVMGDDLKKHICETVSFNKPQNTMQYRVWEYIKPLGMGADKMDDRALGGYRCKVCENERHDCYRRRITNDNAKNSCVADLGGTVVQ